VPRCFFCFYEVAAFFRVLSLDSCTEDMQPGLLHGTSVACFGLNAFLHRELASCIEFVVFLAGKGATVRHSQLHDLTIA
jgi:hypothetical protein